jgi:hypothetical protein
MKDLFTKQKITCSHCGSNEHNIVSCKNLHLPKSMFAKEKKKATGKAKSGMLLHQYKLMCLLPQTHKNILTQKYLFLYVTTGKAAATKKNHQHVEDAEKNSRSTGSKRSTSAI